MKSEFLLGYTVKFSSVICIKNVWKTPIELVLDDNSVELHKWVFHINFKKNLLFIKNDFKYLPSQFTCIYPHHRITPSEGVDNLEKATSKPLWLCSQAVGKAGAAPWGWRIEAVLDLDGFCCDSHLKIISVILFERKCIPWKDVLWKITGT